MVSDRIPLRDEDTAADGPIAALRSHGVVAVIATREADIVSIPSDSLPNLVLVDCSSIAETELRRCLQICSRLELPKLLIVPEARLPEIEQTLVGEEFVVSPPSATELVTRAKIILRRTSGDIERDLLRYGDLVIDPTNYEVLLKGRRIHLRFKEYELLRMLAGSPGRVFTREALLSNIWGYDYFGGTRTVDVHVRRLRSKIDDADHGYIETIWNVGYRFKNPGQSS